MWHAAVLFQDDTMQVIIADTKYIVFGVKLEKEIHKELQVTGFAVFYVRQNS